MKILMLTVFFALFSVFWGCTEKKEDESIYGPRADKDNVKDDDDTYVKYDSDSNSDSDMAVQDSDLLIKPDNDQILPDNTIEDDQDTQPGDEIIYQDIDFIDDTDHVQDPDSNIDPDNDSIFVPDIDTNTPPECGNGTVETGEKCETDQLKACTAVDPVNYSSGWATCKTDCSGWVTTACVGKPCSEKPDLPDPLFEDTNCDGIDGVIEDSVFVDSFNGSDLNDGSKSSPVATIMKGVAKALSLSKKQVLVAGGSYNEIVMLTTGISIHGAYGGYPEWSRNNLFETVIQGGTQAVTCSLSGEMTLSFVTVRSSDATVPGSSSFGMVMKNCENVTLNNVKIIAGKGANGTDGVDGAEGQDATAGQQGYPGCESSGGLFCDECSQPLGGPAGTSPCGMNGGKGGTPGRAKANGNPGENGAGSTTNGGDGGIGNNFDDMCLYYEGLQVHGDDGLAGEFGTDGPGGANLGNLNENGYTPANGTSGTPGGNGQGGGGGGGGKGGTDWCDSYGSSGGGGGGGGCGGTNGTGGGGGGGSFALLIYKSSGIVFQNVVLQTSAGGKGGLGGQGKKGGLGGLGGEGGPFGGTGEEDDAGCGGWGGDGGNGGKGGHGGGGGGGPSVCLVKIESDIDGMFYTSFLPGSGGEGGYSDANSGDGGLSISYVEY